MLICCVFIDLLLLRLHQLLHLHRVVIFCLSVSACAIDWLLLVLGLHLSATSLFKILLKYRPDDKAEKKERLLKRAQAEADGKPVEAKKPIVVNNDLVVMVFQDMWIVGML